ncbi:MAG: hypothetical protein DUW69_001613 [Verrucomicrobia bacterium]|nr:MAG: hypothetical protein DUW69_001613 [Verrucomicrobiota bacterium]
MGLRIGRQQQVATGNLHREEPLCRSEYHGERPGLSSLIPGSCKIRQFMLGCWGS